MATLITEVILVLLLNVADNEALTFPVFMGSPVTRIGTIVDFIKWTEQVHNIEPQ